MGFLLEGIQAITWQQVVMWIIGGLLIWLAIKKDFEPALLLPMGFGAILVNIPFTGVLNSVVGEETTHGIIEWLFNVGINASEAFPLLLFVGIGAMIDFGPLLSNPRICLLFTSRSASSGIFLQSHVLIPETSQIIASLRSRFPFSSANATAAAGYSPKKTKSACCKSASDAIA